MITRSLNKAAYISYCTDFLGDVIENANGMYIFSFKDSLEVKKALEEYNKCIILQEKLFVDLVRYNKIILQYKSLIKLYKEKKIIDMEFKFQWDKKEELHDKVDKICDKIINNLEN